MVIITYKYCYDALYQLGYYFIYSSFFHKIVRKKNTFYLFCIDNENVSHILNLHPLDYGYLGVYLQKCKVTGNPTLLIALLFCLKVGM